MEPTTREVLKLFVKKADRLLQRSYVRFVREHGIKYTVRFSPDTVDMVLKCPDDEDTDASILTLRMFIQKKDRCSFERLAKLSTSDTGL